MLKVVRNIPSYFYIPSKAPHDIFTREAKAGIKLYVKRVFIMDDADNLIPNYLRFVQGSGQR